MALDLKATEVLADVGTRTVYLMSRFARHVATAYAVDIDPNYEYFYEFRRR